MNNKKLIYLTQAAMIAALYVALTYVFAPFSFREIQVRISEALTILPVFTPAAVPGLFVGCLLGNFLGGAVLPDVICGSLATLVGAYFTRKLRNGHPFLAPIPPIAANTLVVPFVLRYAYCVGVFSSYVQALLDLNTVRVLGFPDARIVAFSDGRPIPVDQARQEE